MKKMTKAQEITHKMRDAVNAQWNHAAKELTDHIKESQNTNTHVNDTLIRAKEVQRCADQLIVLDNLILELFNEDA